MIGTTNNSNRMVAIQITGTVNIKDGFRDEQHTRINHEVHLVHIVRRACHDVAHLLTIMKRLTFS